MCTTHVYLFNLILERVIHKLSSNGWGMQYKKKKKKKGSKFQNKPR